MQAEDGLDGRFDAGDGIQPVEPDPRPGHLVVVLLAKQDSAGGGEAGGYAGKAGENGVEAPPLLAAPRVVRSVGADKMGEHQFPVTGLERFRREHRLEAIAADAEAVHAGVDLQHRRYRGVALRRPAGEHLEVLHGVDRGHEPPCRHRLAVGGRGPVEEADRGVGEGGPELGGLVGAGGEEGPASGALEGEGRLSHAVAVAVGFDDGGAFRVPRQFVQRPPVVGEPVEVDAGDEPRRRVGHS